jgi:hypothetical protein
LHRDNAPRHADARIVLAARSRFPEPKERLLALLSRRVAIGGVTINDVAPEAACVLTLKIERQLANSLDAAVVHSRPPIDDLDDCGSAACDRALVERQMTALADLSHG